MRRRQFISTAIAGIASLMVDPGKLLRPEPVVEWYFKTAYWQGQPPQTVAVWNRLVKPEEIMFLCNKGRGLTYSELITNSYRRGTLKRE